VIRLEYKHTKYASFIAYLKPRIDQFVLHKFVARWQDELFNMCLVKQGFDTLILVVYYVIKEQNEIQNQ
jgi:hypothetical protein